MEWKISCGSSVCFKDFSFIWNMTSSGSATLWAGIQHPYGLQLCLTCFYGNGLVLYLKEMLSDCAGKACGTQSTISPTCTQLSFLPLGRASSLLGRSTTYEVTFIHPLLMPLLSKDSECVTVAKISTKNLKQLLSQRPPVNQKNAQERKCQNSLKGMEGSFMPKKKIAAGLISHLLQGGRMAWAGLSLFCHPAHNDEHMF